MDYKRMYQAVVDRGLITEKTTQQDFLKKMHEEVYEVIESYYKYMSYDHILEVGDLITVCCNYLTHYDIDIEEIIEQVTLKNERRKK